MFSKVNPIYLSSLYAGIITEILNVVNRFSNGNAKYLLKLIATALESTCLRVKILGKNFSKLT